MTQILQTKILKALCVFITAFFSCLGVAEQPAQQVSSGVTVMALLSKMADANRELNYRGIFTYEFGGVLKTVRVAHRVRDGLEYEKLTYLDGPEREIIRQGRQLSCRRVGDMLLRGIDLQFNDLQSTRLEDHYNLFIKGQSRVAGREVTEVHVVPKDAHRYGYAMSIDRETGLLMRSMLVAMGEKNRVLERFQFVDLELGVMLVDEDLMPTVEDHMVAAADSAPCFDPTRAPPTLRQWRASWLPPGFVLAGYQPKEEGRAESMVYSDGLAVFSIFIDAVEEVPLAEIEASRGATIAYATRKGVDNRDFTICVVGEIPSSVAKQVALSVAPLQ